MNTVVINSSLLLNHSSSGFSFPLGDSEEECIESLGELSFDYIVKIINLLVGYPANLMVMWLVYRKKSDSSTSDIFIFSLAIADVCCCMMLPISVFGAVSLGIIDFMFFVRIAFGMKEASPLFLACICLDRYMAVVHPIAFTSIRDNKIRAAISMLVWGFTFPFAVCRSMMPVVRTNIFVGLLLVTFAIMVFCNISIMWSLRKSVMGKEKMHPMKKKAHRTVLIAPAIIVFNYLPIVTFGNVMRYFYFSEICQVKYIAFTFMEMSSSIEPLIYISKMEQLPCFNNLPCICCRSSSTGPHSISTRDVCL